MNLGNSLDREISLDCGTAECSGTLSRSIPFVFSDLKLTRNMSASARMYTGLHFFTPPGYELHDIEPREVAFYRDVKRKTKEYFTKECPVVQTIETSDT